jgi:hypothetical protein
VGLKLNGAHELLFYADDVNILGDDIDTIKKNTQTLIKPSINNPQALSPPKHYSNLGNHFEANVSAIYGAKTEHTGLKPYRNVSHSTDLLYVSATSSLIREILVGYALSGLADRIG